MFNRYILIKCCITLLRIAIANIWGGVKCRKTPYGESIRVTHLLKLYVNVNQGLILIIFLFTVLTTWVRLALSESR